MVKVTCPEVDQIILDAGDYYYGPNDIDVQFDVEPGESPGSALLTLGKSDGDDYYRTAQSIILSVEATADVVATLLAVKAAVDACLKPLRDLIAANRDKRAADEEKERLAKVEQSTAPKVVCGLTRLVMPQAAGKTVAEVKSWVADVWPASQTEILMRHADCPFFQPDDDVVIRDGDTIEFVNTEEKG